jgi:pimeloyl-ACP methyl ester carboxylesterase
MSTIKLRRSQQTVEIPGSGIRMHAPGLEGTLVWHGPRETSALRAETAESPLLTQALQEAGLEDRHTLEVNALTPVRRPGYKRNLLTDVAPDEVDIDVPVRANELQFAIYTDEDGVTTIQFPNPRPKAAAAVTARSGAAGQTVTYRILLRKAKGRPENQIRSRFIGGLARKVIKIVARIVLKPIAGQAIFAAAQAWEDRYRVEGFHGGTSQELLNTPVLPHQDWGVLSGKKTLLFIHGTTSSTAGAFQGLNEFDDVARELYRRYEGRVLGFNHHTLTKSVAQNVVEFFDAIVPGNYCFDIVSHSRGGLVARSLVELHPGAISKLLRNAWSLPRGVRLDIGKIVFVGTPNAATDLADPKDVPAILNRLAAIVGLLKDAPPVLALGAVLSIASGVAQAILEGVADLGEASLKSLPGLVDMAPGCAFLGSLTDADPSRYWGIQAQYRADGGLKAALENKGVDILFHDKANDLVVPTDGVSHNANFQLACLTPPHVFAFKPQDKVNHVNYFYQQPTWTAILGFLQ